MAGVVVSGTERATPFYCPYCADEDLRPVAEPHGAWRCTGCLRVFVVRFVGLAPRSQAPRSEAPSSGVIT
jgi:transposase-like protein